MRTLFILLVVCGFTNGQPTFILPTIKGHTMRGITKAPSKPDSTLNSFYFDSGVIYDIPRKPVLYIGQYFIEFNPDYSLFKYEENEVIKDMMFFEMNISLQNYFNWERYTKAKFDKTDCDKFITVYHRDGSLSEYTLQEFRKYLWPN